MRTVFLPFRVDGLYRGKWASFHGPAAKSRNKGTLHVRFVGCSESDLAMSAWHCVARSAGVRHGTADEICRCTGDRKQGGGDEAAGRGFDHRDGLATFLEKGTQIAGHGFESHEDARSVLWAGLNCALSGVRAGRIRAYAPADSVDEDTDERGHHCQRGVDQ